MQNKSKNHEKLHTSRKYITKIEFKEVEAFHFMHMVFFNEQHKSPNFSRLPRTCGAMASRIGIFCKPEASEEGEKLGKKNVGKYMPIQTVFDVGNTEIYFSEFLINNY